jgi:hypothetical protein
MSQPQSTAAIQADVKRITRLLSRRPPEGKRRIRLLRDRARLEAELVEVEEDEYAAS